MLKTRTLSNVICHRSRLQGQYFLLAILFAGVALGGVSLCAQMVAPVAATAKLRPYDVVSIKPNKSGSGHIGIHTRDATFAGDNVSLKTLLLNAYSLKDGQLVNLPPWAESARFDIEAKVLDPDPAIYNDLTREQRGTMLQGMLAERFGLKMHTATAVLPVYELVVAKGGSKLKASATSDRSVSVHNTEMTATGVTLATLVDELSGEVGRVVVDKTGLSGNFDLALKWSKDDAPVSDNAPPPLFTALQEQLGLRLVAAKDAVETFVVDHVEMPSEN